jgi:hypothetical protein
LVGGDTNGVADIFLKRGDAPLSRVSVGTSSTGETVESDNPSDEPAISPVLPDGTYAVAFSSHATNLVPDFLPAGFDGYIPKQIYLRIPRLNKTVLVSSALPGGSFVFGNGDSTKPSITSVVERAGPRYIVTFSTFATNIQDGGTVQAPNPYQYSRIVIAIVDGKSGDVLRKSEILPISSAGFPIEANGSFLAPVINGAGDSVVFMTDATNLGWGATAGVFQVALATRRSSAGIVFPTDITQQFPSSLQLLSKANEPDGAGVRQPGTQTSFSPAISFSGDYVAFGTQAFNLFERTHTTLALWNRETDTLSAVNSDIDGNVPEDSFPEQYALRRNGRLVLFSDTSSSLTADGDTNDARDLFAKDLVDGRITRLNKRGELQSNLPVGDLAIGGVGYNVDRSTVAFASPGNLVTAGDPGTANVFRLELRYPPPRLVAGTPLQSPPDVTVRGTTCKLVLQRFSNTGLSSSDMEFEDGLSSAASKVSYDIRLKNSSTKKTLKRTSTSVRVTIRNLKPGTYSVKYRAQGKKGKKVVSTAFSPSVSVTIKR